MTPLHSITYKAYVCVCLLLADTSDSFGPFVTLRVWVQIQAESYACHRGYAYTVLQTVQIPGVCSAFCGNMHYNEPLNSFR